MMAIMRTKKLHGTGGVAWAAKHNTRERDTPNADPSKTKENTVLLGAHSADQAMAIWRRQADLVDRKIRDNAVTAIEYMITASPDAFDSGKANDDYFKDALAWVVKRHGEANVVQAVIHRDETTPHLHVLVIPILEKTKRYTHKTTKETTERQVVALEAKAWLNGPKTLADMQTDFATNVGASYGLKRGKEKSQATHEEIAAWYSRMRSESGGNTMENQGASVTSPPPSPTPPKPQIQNWQQAYEAAFEAAMAGDRQAAAQFRAAVTKEKERREAGLLEKWKGEGLKEYDGREIGQAARKLSEKSVVDQIVGYPGTEEKLKDILETLDAATGKGIGRAPVQPQRKVATREGNER